MPLTLLTGWNYLRRREERACRHLLLMPPRCSQARRTVRPPLGGRRPQGRDDPRPGQLQPRWEGVRDAQEPPRRAEGADRFAARSAAARAHDPQRPARRAGIQSVRSTATATRERPEASRRRVEGGGATAGDAPCLPAPVRVDEHCSGRQRARPLQVPGPRRHPGHLRSLRAPLPRNEAEASRLLDTYLERAFIGGNQNADREVG